MEGVTGMMAQLGHVPGCSREGFYGPANIDFQTAEERQRREGSDVRRARVSIIHVPFAVSPGVTHVRPRSTIRQNLFRYTAVTGVLWESCGGRRPLSRAHSATHGLGNTIVERARSQHALQSKPRQKSFLWPKVLCAFSFRYSAVP